jgi:hypothetical protein
MLQNLMTIFTHTGREKELAAMTELKTLLVGGG